MGDIKNLLFSDRQVDILQAMYAHPDEKHPEIADRLGVKEPTLKTHLRMMYKVVGVHTDKGLIVTLIKAGWYEQPHEPIRPSRKVRNGIE